MSPEKWKIEDLMDQEREREPKRQGEIRNNIQDERLYEEEMEIWKAPLRELRTRLSTLIEKEQFMDVLIQLTNFLSLTHKLPKEVIQKVNDQISYLTRDLQIVESVYNYAKKNRFGNSPPRRRYDKDSIQKVILGDIDGLIEMDNPEIVRAAKREAILKIESDQPIFKTLCELGTAYERIYFSPGGVYVDILRNKYQRLKSKGRSEKKLRTWLAAIIPKMPNCRRELPKYYLPNQGIPRGYRRDMEEAAFDDMVEGTQRRKEREDYKWFQLSKDEQNALQKQRRNELKEEQKEKMRSSDINPQIKSIVEYRARDYLREGKFEDAIQAVVEGYASDQNLKKRRKESVKTHGIALLMYVTLNRPASGSDEMKELEKDIEQFIKQPYIVYQA